MDLCVWAMYAHVRYCSKQMHPLAAKKDQKNTADLNALIHQSDSTSIGSIGKRLLGVVSTGLITGDPGAPRAGTFKGVYSGV